MGIEVTYYGHSCFVLSCGGYRVALDPYGPLPGYRPLRIEAEDVYCSHGHFDHNFVKAVKLTRGSGKQDPFEVTYYDIPHDDAGGTLRGMNKITVFEAEGIRIAHFGDIGCPLSAELTSMLRGLDAALVPVGGFYTIDAQGALDLKNTIQPRVFVPMHYRDGKRGLKEIGTLDDFLALAGGGTRLDSNTFEVTKDAPEGIIVPAYR